MSPHDPEGGSWLSDQEQPWGIGCKACSFSKCSSKFAMYAVREAGSLQHENLKKHTRTKARKLSMGGTTLGRLASWLMRPEAILAVSRLRSASWLMRPEAFLAVSQLRSAMGKTIQVLHQSPGFPNFSQVVIHVQLGIVFAFSLGLKFEAK